MADDPFADWYVHTVDDTVPQNVLSEVAEEIGATSARSVNLV